MRSNVDVPRLHLVTLTAVRDRKCRAKADDLREQREALGVGMQHDHDGSRKPGRQISCQFAQGFQAAERRADDDDFARNHVVYLNRLAWLPMRSNRTSPSPMKQWITN